MASFVENFLEPLACLVNVVALVVVIRKEPGRSLGLLLFNHTACALMLLFGSFMVLKKGTNIWIYDLVALSTALFTGAYFYRQLYSRRKKHVVLIFIGLYLVYALYRNLSLSGPRWFDSIGFAIVSASITAYVFMYFQQVLQNVTEASIFRDFNFWLSAAYLLYFAGGFIIFISYFYFTQKLLSNPFKAGTRMLTSLWGLHNVLLSISALCLLMGSLWVLYHKRSD